MIQTVGGELDGSSPTRAPFPASRLSVHGFAPPLSVLIGFTLLASAEGQPRLSPGRVVPIAQLLASPDRYAEKEVLIRGTVVKKARGVFPNDRPYFTLLVSDGEGAIRVVFPGGTPGRKRGFRRSQRHLPHLALQSQSDDRESAHHPIRASSKFSDRGPTRVCHGRAGRWWHGP